MPDLGEAVKGGGPKRCWCAIHSCELGI